MRGGREDGKSGTATATATEMLGRFGGRTNPAGARTSDVSVERMGSQSRTRAFEGRHLGAVVVDWLARLVAHW